MDEAEFFISPNPGEELRPLARVASGGELSRIMLAVKTLAARTSLSGRRSGAHRKTLIFDEVDAGISGQVADVVGRRLQDLGGQFQVLCITHLPQIAARGTTQFRISKGVRGDRTTTAVERLDVEPRVAELARMLSGTTVTAAGLTSAREMLAIGAAEQAKAKGESESPVRGESAARRRRRT